MNAGCNVVMPNLSPKDTRKKYLLYDNKRSDGDEAAEGSPPCARAWRPPGTRSSWTAATTPRNERNEGGRIP